MSLPHLLLVDDSEAILAYEQAALAGHYRTTTASNGRLALESLRAAQPAAMLLDLSMPEMDGDEVLRQMKAHPIWATIPVIVVSSEASRGEASMRAGAADFLRKPLRADELRARLASVLATAQTRREQGRLAVLPVGVGTQELGLPLSSVERVTHQPATSSMPWGPSYLREWVSLAGEPVCVLDLARRLGLAHAEPLAERKLVFVQAQGLKLALCVDRVLDPEVFDAASVTPAEALGGAVHGLLPGLLVAMVRRSSGILPVVDCGALLSASLARQLRGELQRAVSTPDGRSPERSPS